MLFSTTPKAVVTTQFPPIIASFDVHQLSCYEGINALTGSFHKRTWTQDSRTDNTHTSSGRAYGVRAKVKVRT